MPRNLCLSALMLVLLFTRARAGVEFPSVVERIGGARIDVAPVRTSLGDELARVRVEVADQELYGIAGLRSSGVRAAGTVRALMLSTSIVDVASAVGTHARAVVEVGARAGHAWQGAVRAGAERLTLVESAPVTWRVCGVVSRVDVGRVATIADVEVIDGHGDYETSVSLCARFQAGSAQLIASMRIDDDRFVGAGMAVVARVHPSLALLAGYDDGAESLRAGAVIDWRGIELATGVFQHPVLGMSQGVSIACVR